MLEILGEDRERIEELHREIKKEQERIAIRSLIATQKALMMLEGMSLQVTLSGQSEKMRSFATTTLVSDLKEESYYNNEWGLMVPEGIFEIN